MPNKQPPKNQYSYNYFTPYTPNVLQPESCMKYPHDIHDDEMVVYLLQNFGINFGITEIHYENLSHFIDGLQAHRAYFQSINAKSLAQKMDDFLQKIEHYLDEWHASPEGKRKQSAKRTRDQQKPDSKPLFAKLNSVTQNGSRSISASNANAPKIRPWKIATTCPHSKVFHTKHLSSA